MTTRVSDKVSILWKVNAVNSILVTCWDYVKSFESLVRPYPYLWVVSLFTSCNDFSRMIGLHTDQGIMMFVIMPLCFGLTIVNDSQFANKINNFQKVVLTLNDSHDFLYIVDSDAIDPPDIKAYVTVRILNFFLVKCLQLRLDLTDVLFINRLIYLIRRWMLFDLMRFSKGFDIYLVG